MGHLARCCPGGQARARVLAHVSQQTTPPIASCAHTEQSPALTSVNSTAVLSSNFLARAMKRLALLPGVSAPSRESRRFATRALPPTFFLMIFSMILAIELAHQPPRAFVSDTGASAFLGTASVRPPYHPHWFDVTRALVEDLRSSRVEPEATAPDEIDGCPVWSDGLVLHRRCRCLSHHALLVPNKNPRSQ